MEPERHYFYPKPRLTLLPGALPVFPMLNPVPPGSAGLANSTMYPHLDHCQIWLLGLSLRHSMHEDAPAALTGSHTDVCRDIPSETTLLCPPPPTQQAALARGSVQFMSQPSPKLCGGLRSSHHIPLIPLWCLSGEKALFSLIKVFGVGVLNDPFNVIGEKNGQSLNLARVGP